MAGLFDQYLKAVQPKVRSRTYESYEYAIRVHLRPGIGHIPVARLIPAQLDAFLASKSAVGLAPQTVARLRAVCRQALAWGERQGIVGRNVAKLTEAPRISREDLAVLSPEQVGTFLSAIRGDRLEALFMTALAIGARQGELLGLRWPDVSLSAAPPTLSIRHALLRRPGPPQLVEPKSMTSRRTVALPATVGDALRQHRARQLEERLRVGRRWQGERWDLIFCTAIGTPLDGVAVTRRLQRMLAANGLPKLRFHDLRHSSATLMLAQGVPARIVADTLGHSDVRLTLNTYTHVPAQLQAVAAERMDAALVVARGSY
jgi:integrase